jgi:hypothetical protein
MNASFASYAPKVMLCLRVMNALKIPERKIPATPKATDARTSAMV